MKKTKTVVERKTCRISGEKLVPLFSLGDLYVSDFLPKGESAKNTIPLTLKLGCHSGLVQLAHTTPADIMYRKYWYKSGTNASMTNELRSIAELVQTLIPWRKGDVFVDIGCNDGTLLKFVSEDFIKIGFDPNDYAAESSRYANIIVNDYFSYQSYRKTKYGKKKASIISSIAMFYDLENPRAFVKDVYKTLERNGIWIIQMSYLPLMLKQLAFDNICHEHIEYYSLTALNNFVKTCGFEVVDCERDARVYFRDIFKYLKNYKIYRIMRDGLYLVTETGRFEELLFTTNYLAKLK